MPLACISHPRFDTQTWLPSTSARGGEFLCPSGFLLLSRGAKLLLTPFQQPPQAQPAGSGGRHLCPTQRINHKEHPAITTHPAVPSEGFPSLTVPAGGGHSAQMTELERITELYKSYNGGRKQRKAENTHESPPTKLHSRRSLVITSTGHPLPK